MNRKKAAAWLSAIAVTAALMIPTTANAAVPSPLTNTSGASSPAPSPDPRDGDPLADVDLSVPEVAERVATIEGEGGEILGGQTVDYVAEGEDDAAARAFPSGCGLTVIIYKQTSQIVSDNLTSCTSTFTSVDMESDMWFWAWLNWYTNWIAGKDDYATLSNSLAVEYAFNCTNSTDSTNFRTETRGILVKSGTTYTASAYDEVNTTNCGTS